MTMEWLSANWQELAADVGVAIGAITAIVVIIAKWAKWKGVEKVVKPLRWIHDKLSPLSLGNQTPLNADRAPTDKDG